MTRVLVAGATGYLGRYVVQAAKARGYWVRALVRSADKLAQVGPFLEPAVDDAVDEVFVGEITRPATLAGVCAGIDVVFSSVGLTRQKDGLTYRDVDYQGNINLLTQAQSSGVRTFVYVSVLNAHRFEHLAIIRAHEDVVRALAASGMATTIIRPTGYFSDMSELLRMAAAGRVLLIGAGENQVNPIHGADLAECCVAAMAGDRREIPIGGPQVYTQRAIAALAFRTLGRPAKVIAIPPWLAAGAVALIRPFNRQLADLGSFFVTAGQADGVAPASGSRTLEAYFAELAATWRAQSR